MTERKPPGMSFETWVDFQIAQGLARGDFDGLAGAGKPLSRAALDETGYEWVLAKARKENLDVFGMLPPGLALKKEREDLPRRAERNCPRRPRSGRSVRTTTPASRRSGGVRRRAGGRRSRVWRTSKRSSSSGLGPGRHPCRSSRNRCRRRSRPGGAGSGDVPIPGGAANSLDRCRVSDHR